MSNPSLPGANESNDSGQRPAFQETLAFDEATASQPTPADGSLAETGNPPFEQSADRSSLLTRRLAGQTFGDFELLEEIGRGGMGVVCKARQVSLDRLVAIKILLASEYTDPTRLARFQAEARAAASLTHPNIVQVYQVGVSPFGHYFVMEYVDGVTLETMICQGQVRSRMAVKILIEVADAVHYAHTRGIVHRDLKPANIMVDKSGRPVVTDFGIAKFVGKSSSLTQEGVVMGTPAFMAPEQAGDPNDTHGVGPHSDVYSLGAIMYTLLAGRVPYDEGNALRTILKLIGPDMPPPLRDFRPRVHPELERICMTCMQKNPANRFPTAAALAEELRRFFQQLAQKTSGTRTRLPKPVLILTSGSTGKRIRVSRPESLVGRSSDCDVIIRAADVSKHHCRILIQSDRVIVEDLHSANGTFLNDQPVTRAHLKPGDRLRLADHEFKIEIQRPPA